MVSFSERPEPVHAGLVLELKRRCDDSGHMLPPDQFSTVDKVRLISGLFASFAATVEKVDAEKRVWILMDLMGQ